GRRVPSIALSRWVTKPLIFGLLRAFTRRFLRCTLALTPPFVRLEWIFLFACEGPPGRTATMDDAIRKAEALIEARGYIRTFRDRLTVIKLGGSAMENPAALAGDLEDVVFMETAGMRPLLVHGGGKAIDRAMATANLRPTKVQGRRVTDAATLEIVGRVLRDEINADLVARIRALGGRA